jgi:hypothetical protein
MNRVKQKMVKEKKEKQEKNKTTAITTQLQLPP